MRARWIGLAAIVAVGTARAEAPVDSARSIVAAQLAVIRDPAALVGTLAPDAMILGNGSFALARGESAVAVLATLAPWPVAQTMIARLDAGRFGDALWFSADLVLVDGVGIARRRCIGRYCSYVRLFELAIGTRVVALSFTSTANITAAGDAIGASRAGPLVALLGSPDRLDAALRDDSSTIVAIAGVGQVGEVAVGSDKSHRLWAPWRYRDVRLTNVVEIDRDNWGFAMGDIALGSDPHEAWQPPHTVHVLLVAIPIAGAWKVVALHAIDTAPPRRDEVIPSSLDRFGAGADDVPLATRSIAP